MDWASRERVSPSRPGRMNRSDFRNSLFSFLPSEHVIALLNNSPGPLNITLVLGDVMDAPPLQAGQERMWQVWDLWWPRESASRGRHRTYLGPLEEISSVLRSHQTKVWRMKPVSSAMRVPTTGQLPFMADV